MFLSNLAVLSSLLQYSTSTATTQCFGHETRQVVHAQPYGTNAVRVRLFAQYPTERQLAIRGYLLPAPAAERGSGEDAAAGKVLCPERSGTTVTSGNIEVSLSASEGVTLRRVSDGQTLLAQAGPISASALGADGRAQLNASLRVEATNRTQLRFFGGGCKCGGGFNREDGHDGGAMINTGRTGSEDLVFGVPIGRAPSPHIPGMTGGLGSQWSAKKYAQ